MTDEDVVETENSPVQTLVMMVASVALALLLKIASTRLAGGT